MWLFHMKLARRFILLKRNLCIIWIFTHTIYSEEILKNLLRCTSDCDRI